MDYSFWNTNNTQLNKIKFKKNDNWAEIAKKTNNAKFNSLWTLVDNGDGIVQKDELKMLNQLLKAADKSVEGSKADKKINNEELIALTQKIQDGTIAQEVDETTAERIKSNLSKSGWSEGIDRRINKINISSINSNGAQGKQFPLIKSELEAIGKEVGFEVNDWKLYNDGGIWVEDYSVRRPDGKMVILSEDAAGNVIANRRNRDGIIQNRKNISNTSQGSAASYFDLVEAKIQPQDVIHSKSYLEGGNVLNTKLADGTPAAVIGEESIGYTLHAMELENSDENIEIAKKQIADDLGLKPENVTFMPQYDFHIDMAYRPLHNGQMAVPDYDEGIKLLQETNIEGMSDKSKQELITKMTEMRDKTADIRAKAEEKLTESGYEIVKIPCFATDSNSTINYMNGIGGTSKTGESFYITNKSDYPELNKAMEKYFQKAGVDKMYFVSTTPFLRSQGGIDCLTQEE